MVTAEPFSFDKHAEPEGVSRKTGEASMETDGRPKDL